MADFIHIKFTRVDGFDLLKLACPTCTRKRPSVALATWEMWYGWSATCMRCGDSWGDDGEMAERPFMPRWRKEEVLRCRKQLCGLIAAHGRPPWHKPMEELMPEQFTANVPSQGVV